MRKISIGDPPLEVAGAAEPGCEDCKHDQGFTIPHSLVNAIADGEAVIFAGAGIGTENRNVMSWTLFDSLCAELGADPSRSQFPDIMEQYASLPDGRVKLMRKIVERLDYIDSFYELRNDASEFHNELATLFSIDTVVTTNWDTLFERLCACQPFVLDADMAFWNSARRRVLKIHGSVGNLSTIVATRSDYLRNRKALHKNLVGSQLKNILSGKTVVFCGYSLRDEDFTEIMDFVGNALGAFKRQHYIVTIDSDETSLARFKSSGLIPVCTNATYFLRNVKAHIARTRCVTPDTVYTHAMDALGETIDAHETLYRRYKLRDYPEIIYCACYQDGLIHCLRRIVDARTNGAYSDLHVVQQKLLDYEKWQTQKLRKKNSMTLHTSKATCQASCWPSFIKSINIKSLRHTIVTVDGSSGRIRQPNLARR
ncbi:MAG: SIR2 family protein [Alphaproteobacteria bacterium]